MVTWDLCCLRNRVYWGLSYNVYIYKSFQTGAMDAFSRGLKAAAQIIEEGVMDKHVQVGHFTNHTYAYIYIYIHKHIYIYDVFLKI